MNIPEGWNIKHGMRMGENRKKGTEYTVWVDMRRRCSNPKHRAFKWYGAKGVSVCDRWQEFKNFFEDMGQRPEGTSLDRINPQGNYEPGNCRWADSTIQGRNRSGVKLNLEIAIEILRKVKGGATKQKIADEYGVTRELVREIAYGRRWKEAGEYV